MYDNLTLWFQLVQRFISQTAFVEDDRVYIKEAGITEIPVFDPAVVMKLMNQFPHLLNELYNEWRIGAEDFNVQREFSIIVLEDMLEQDVVAAKRAEISEDEVRGIEEDAMAGIVNLLVGMGFNILNHTDNPRFGERTEIIKSGGQFQL